MRARTEKKRREIVQKGAELFEELGYERTSMSAIAARVGGSKATIYNYFRSKEDLLRAVLDREVNDETDRLMQAFLSENDLRSALIRLGTNYLDSHVSRTASIRSVANQPIAEEFYANVLRPAWQRLADRFAIMMEEGRLKFADPWVVAMHWKGLNEWDRLERHLLCANPEDSDGDVVKIATFATDAFLQLYAGPAEPPEMVSMKRPPQTNAVSFIKTMDEQKL